MADFNNLNDYVDMLRGLASSPSSQQQNMSPLVASAVPQELQRPSLPPLKQVKIRVPMQNKVSSSLADPGSLINELFAPQREDSDKLRQIADEYEARKNPVDMKGLASIVDMWTGGNSAAHVAPVMTPEDKQLHVAKLRALAGESDKDIAKEKIGLWNNANNNESKLAMAELKGQLTGMGSPFKRNNQLDKWQKDFGKDMDVYGSIRSVKGKIADTEIRASRLKTLIEAIKSGNADPQEMASLGEGMANMISNGAVSEERVRHFIPSSAGKTIAEWKQWFTAQPTGADQQKFVDRYAYELANESKNADRQLADFRRKNVTKHQMLWRDPEGRQNMLLQASGFGIAPEEVATLFDPKLIKDRAKNYREIPDATEPGGAYQQAATRGEQQVSARAGNVNAPAASGGKTIKSKMYSPSRNKTKIIYSDDSEAIVDGKQ
jgi:hypothetical protein